MIRGDVSKEPCYPSRTIDANKLSRKTKRCLSQLEKHDPSVKVSKVPTKTVFVGNSSVLCGISLDDLEKIFHEYDENCEITVFPDRRSYSFVDFGSVDIAKKAFDSLHGKVPNLLGSNAVPFYMAFVENVPSEERHQQSKPPADLWLLKDFINEKEEADLMASLENCIDKKTKLKYRKVVHFGYKFNYDTNDAFTPSELPIPLSCAPIIERMLKAGVFTEPPDQITVNVYEPGNGIPSHVDAHSPFGDTIASLSLLSGLVMEWRDFANTSSVYDVLLPRFSLAVFKGESRYRWKHGIAKRKYDINPENNKLIRRQVRVSFTFRNVAKQKCQCPYIEYCDWDRNGTMKIPDDDRHGRNIENEYVTNVYESIADHFDTTRHAQWLAVSQFLNELPPYSIVYDVGCGNGKYLVRKDQLIKFGCDMCENLCRITMSKGCNVVRADALSLPFKDGSADAVISIAVIHHMSTESRRIRAVQEVLRLLCSGGRACITVWSMEQKYDNTVSEYLKMRGKKSNVQCNRRASNGRLRVHEGRDFTQQDVLVPFQNVDGERFLRYYHLFVAGELEELVNKAGGCVVDGCAYEQGNWIIIIRKDN